MEAVIIALALLALAYFISRAKAKKEANDEIYRSQLAEIRRLTKK